MNQESRLDDHMQEYVEPTRDDIIERRGGVPSAREADPYEEFMAEEGIPVYRGIGMYDSRQLPLAPWQRMGGQGTFIELDGQAGYFGMYLVEVPAGGVLNPERHMYEEVFLVIEGRGTTEVWRKGSSKRQSFEWQTGTFFGVPLNIWHRLVNATTSPALVLAATSAPNMIDFFPSRSFIFDNPYQSRDRYDESKDYFKPRDKIIGGTSTFATLRTNLIPDVAQCYVPRANMRAPGQGHLRLRDVAGSNFFLNHIQEYPSGRYSTAHAHEAGRVLVCIKGKGYSLNWPIGLGKRPWEAGKGHLVNRQDYVPGGMVVAAPGSGDWFHQHLSTAKGGMRVTAFRHPPRSERLRRAGVAGSSALASGLPEGQEFLSGRQVLYSEEDPQVRKDYQEALKKEGAEFTMPESVYRGEAPPAGLNIGGP